MSSEFSSNVCTVNFVAATWKRKKEGQNERQKSRRGVRRKAGRTRAMSRGVKGQQRTKTTLDGDHPRTHTRQNGPTSSSMKVLNPKLEPGLTLWELV